MSDGITDNVTYSQQSFADWKKREIQTFLSMRTTKELVEELAKREGVEEIICPDPDSGYCVALDRSDGKEIDISAGTGAARILVVIDRLKRCGNCARRESRLYCRELTSWQRFIARLFGCYMWWMK